MGKSILAFFGASLIGLATAGTAAPGYLSIVNGTGADITGMEVRRVGGKNWQSVALTAPAGKAASAPFTDPDCAFDLKVALSNGESVIFSGVNLCDAKLLTLRRTGKTAWVDYD